MKCDLCGKKIDTSVAESYVDGPVGYPGAPWANMCLPCHAENGIGFGLGKGNLLPKAKKREEPLPEMEDMTFEQWYKQLDELVEAKYGLGLSDLPDMMTRDAYDDNKTPREFLDEDVHQTMVEDYGEEMMSEF